MSKPPLTDAARQLEGWARKMGFSTNLEVATDTSIYSVATSTPERRRLWAMIMNKVVDRRIVEKVRKRQNNDAEIAKIKDRINQKRIEIAKVEAMANECLTSQKDRIEKLKIDEETQRDNELRSVLCYLRQKKNSQMINWCQSVRNYVTEATDVVTSNGCDPKEWFTAVRLATRDIDSERGLCKAVMSRLNDDKMNNNELWNVLIKSNDDITERFKQATLENIERYKFYAETKPPVGVSWETILKKKKMNCTIADNLRFLIKGVGIAKITNNPCPLEEAILQTIDKFFVSNGFNDEQDLSLPDVEQLQKLTAQLQECSVPHSKAIRNFDELKKRHKRLVKQLQTSQVNLHSLNSKTTNYLTSNSSNWHLALNKLETQITEEWRILCENNLLETLCADIMPNGETDPKITESERPANDPRIEFSLQTILEAIEKNADPDLNGSRGNGLSRSLNLTISRIKNLLEKLNMIRTIIKLSDDQPFGNMIPDSFNHHDGLTFKEWKLQQVLRGFSQRVDQSSFFSLDLTKQ